MGGAGLGRKRRMISVERWAAVAECLAAGLAQVLGQSAALGFVALAEFAEGAAPFRGKPRDVVGSARLKRGMLFGRQRGGCSGAQMGWTLADLGPPMREFQSDF